MSRTPAVRYANVTQTAAYSTRKGDEVVFISGLIVSGPDAGRDVKIAIPVDKALKLAENIRIIAERNLSEAEWELPEDEEDEQEPVHQQIKDLGGVDNPEEAFEPEEEDVQEPVTHKNFYQVVEEVDQIDPITPKDIRINRSATGDWCHVLFNGRIVDQGHIDDVNSRLIEAFFNVQDQPGVDKAPYEKEVPREPAD